MLNWARLFVELANGWAWPIVALGALLIARPHVGALIDRLQTINGMGFQLSLAAAEENLVRAELPAPTENRSPVPPPVAEFDANSQLLDAWQELDELLLAVGRHNGLVSRSTINLVAGLLRKGVIDRPFADSILALRRARNAVAHGETNIDIPQMVEFVGLARQISDRLLTLQTQATLTP